MSKPTYEDFIEHKKLTHKQHLQKRKKYEEIYGSIKKEEAPKERPGVCMCGSGQFKLKMENHELTRLCKSCGNKVVV